MNSKLKKLVIVIISIVALGFILYYGFIFFIAGYNPFIMGKAWKKEQIIAYASANKIPKDEIYLIDSAAIWTRGKGTFPKMYLYNEKGQQLKFHNCFELLKGFVDTLKTSKTYFTLDSTSTLQQELRNFKHIDGSFVDSNLSNQNYYLIYYYPMWMPGINKKKVFPLRDRIAKEPAFKLYLVNCDVREEWHLNLKK